MCGADSATAAGLAQGSAGGGCEAGGQAAGPSPARGTRGPQQHPSAVTDSLSPSRRGSSARSCRGADGRGLLHRHRRDERDDPGTVRSIARCPPRPPTAPAPPGRGHQSLLQWSQLFSAVLQQIKPLIMVSPPAAVGWSGNQCATPHCLLSGSGDRCHKNDGQPAPSPPAVEQPVPTSSHHAAATRDAVFIWPAAAVGEGIPLGDYFYLITSIYLY